jgi:predicted small metal-binding protein
MIRNERYADTEEEVKLTNFEQIRERHGTKDRNESNNEKVKFSVTRAMLQTSQGTKSS